ncbi:putative derlin [[Candida] railenensis]|uniref:Derlin n=1 Tax=[Candida] railenensis TaxID=45579 RepID=A0A9P0QWQ1_9ASCO|nr:putative derlin [[Candida] railenensis]
MTDSLADSVRNIPPVTRFFTISTVIVCFGHSVQLVSPGNLFCYYPIFLDAFKEFTSVWYSPKSGIFQITSALGILLFQCHRFITCFLLPHGIVVGQPLSAIFDIYFFYTFANHLESSQGKFRRNFPDCLWFTLLTGTIILILTFAYNLLWDGSHLPMHHGMMLSCVTYIWSRSSKNSIINFMGIIPIKAYYLPVFNLFIKLVVDGQSSFIDSLIGIIGGYLYQCIQSDTLPIYNLFPGCYGRLNVTNRGANNSTSSGRRVGFNGQQFGSNDTQTTSDVIDESIFDLGYLKAPMWLYNYLNYPKNTSTRSTAFSEVTTGHAPGSVSTLRGQSVNRPAAGGSSSGPKSASSEDKGTASGFSWFGNDHNPFKGKGHRLTD